LKPLEGSNSDCTADKCNRVVKTTNSKRFGPHQGLPHSAYAAALRQHTKLRILHNNHFLRCNSWHSPHTHTYLHDHCQACGEVFVNRRDVLTALFPDPCQPSIYMGIKQAIDDILMLLCHAWHSLQQGRERHPIRL
jgi:hypothetical protein